MKFDENHIITFDGVFQDELDIIIDNIKYVIDLLNKKNFNLSILNVPPVINNWIGNRPIGYKSDKALMLTYNEFFIEYKKWLLFFKNNPYTGSHNKEIISNILYIGPIYRLICSGLNSNSINVIRDNIYVSWSSKPMDKSNSMHSYWMTKMFSKVKYLESKIVNDYGINLCAISKVYSKESEIVYPTTKNLIIKESIIK